MLKQWKFWVGAIISVLFLVYALNGMDLTQVWVDIQRANYGWIIPGVLVYGLGVWVRAWRWHYLLRPMKAIPTARMWPVVVIGYMGNNVYPFRAGEVLRAYVLRRKEGVSISASIATILVERIFDGLVMLLFVFIALPWVPGLPNWLQQIVIFASIAFFGALIVFLAMAAFPDFCRTWYQWGIETFIPEAWQARLLVLADRFMEGLSSLSNIRDVFMVFFTSVIIWLLETVKYFFVMFAFNFTVSFFALMLMNGVVNLATTIPSAPGYVGTFHAPGIAVLIAFDVDPTVAAAYTLVLHAALWLPITLLGFWYMARESLNWSDIDRAVEAREEAIEEAEAEVEAEVLSDSPNEPATHPPKQSSQPTEAN